MSRSSFRSRRPSASMCVALIALFVALGGVGWAATQLPPNSVGPTQLQDGAVTALKLAQASVGSAQIDAGAVQRRVSGGCPAAAAISSVSRSGSVGCNRTLPRETGAASRETTIDTAGTTVLKQVLPAGSAYLAFANPDVVIAGTVAGQHVTVTCVLSVGGVSQTRTAMVEVGPTKQRLETGLSLVASNPATAKSQSAAKLTCSDAFSVGAAPTVGVTAGFSAIQIRS
jgi:hypothetical protein